MFNNRHGSWFLVKNIFFPADHSTMLTSKALQIPLSNNTISMQYFKLKKNPKNKRKDKVVKKSLLCFYFINIGTTTIKLLRIRIAIY